MGEWIMIAAGELFRLSLFRRMHMANWAPQLGRLAADDSPALGGSASAPVYSGWPTTTL